MVDRARRAKAIASLDECRGRSVAVVSKANLADQHDYRLRRRPSLQLQPLLVMRQHDQRRCRRWSIGAKRDDRARQVAMLLDCCVSAGADRSRMKLCGIPAPQGGGIPGRPPPPQPPSISGRLRHPPACADCGRPAPSAAAGPGQACDGSRPKVEHYRLIQLPERAGSAVSRHWDAASRGRNPTPFQTFSRPRLGKP